jgi:thymidylate synthase|tara:strand:+ start:1636 stop:2541 length:906 start_codon:yes stop_codon:yes gene_type:complete
MLKNTLKNTYDKHYEEQYIQLIKDIINEGTLEEGRNGKTYTVIGSSMYFSLENNIIPLLTTKKVAWKTCLKELLWFIKGQTNNKILTEQKCNIWKGNASREFLDSRGLQHLEEDDLGPVYGHQWRFFNAGYKDCHTDYTGKGVDQLKYIIDSLKNEKERTSRRLVMSAWNPTQLNDMALPPCHILVQFNVTQGNKLSCSMYQRSGDVGLGVPFNIASYSFFTHLLAKHCDLEAHEFIYHIGNAHIYDDHLEVLKEQVKRDAKEFPHLTIKNKRDNINDYILEDFEILDYSFHKPIKMKMRV